METNAIELQQKRNGEILLAEARSIKIVDQETRELASSFSTKTRSAIKAIRDWINPEIDAANKLHKSLTAKRNSLEGKFKEAQGIVDTEIGRDFMEQHRIKDEAEAKLRAEAEKQRLQAQEALISQAIDQNDEKLLVEAENVFVPDIKLAEPERSTKTDAGSTNVRMDIRVEVVDKMELVKHLAGANLNLGFVEVDLAYAKKFAKMMNWKPGTMEKPNIMFGLSIAEVPVVSGRSK